MSDDKKNNKEHEDIEAEDVEEDTREYDEDEHYPEEQNDDDAHDGDNEHEGDVDNDEERQSSRTLDSRRQKIITVSMIGGAVLLFFYFLGKIMGGSSEDEPKKVTANMNLMENSVAPPSYEVEKVMVDNELTDAPPLVMPEIAMGGTPEAPEVPTRPAFVESPPPVRQIETPQLPPPPSGAVAESVPAMSPADIFAPPPFVPSNSSGNLGVITSPPSLTAEADESVKANKQARLTTPMIAYGAYSGSSGADKDGKIKSPINADKKPAHTSASQVAVTHYGDRSIMLAQGKLIDAVLETAIDSELQGPIRAIVSSDVYSESGKNVLIPRGSRLVGKYSVQKMQRGRISIVWERLLRSDGIDISLNSVATDRLGRIGITGDLDNRFAELIKSALLVSTITIGTGAVASKLTDSGDVTTTQNKDGNVTTSGSAVDMAITDATAQVNDVLKKAVNNAIPTNPKITVNQGTRLVVHVNNDIVFSRAYANLHKRRN